MSQADAYARLSLSHLTAVTLQPRVIHPDGSIEWETRVRVRVPSAYSGPPPWELEDIAPTDPAAVPQLEALMRQLVLPRLAEVMGLEVAP